MRPPGWRSGPTAAAIFWALAVGMAAGAGAVSSRMVDRSLMGVLEQRVDALELRLQQVSGELGRARRELALYRRLGGQLLPLALAGRLPGELQVAIRTSPGARQVGERLARLLSVAGASAWVSSSAASGEGFPSGAAGGMLPSGAPGQMSPSGGRVQGKPLGPAGASGEWVVLETSGAVVVGQVGAPGGAPGRAREAGRDGEPGRAREGKVPAASGGGPRTDGVAPVSGPVAWVDGIDEPAGMLAAVEALLSCPKGRVAAEEALDRLARRSHQEAFQRDRACLAGGGAERGDRDRPAPP